MKEELEKLYRCRLTHAEKDRGPSSLTAAVRDGDLDTAKKFVEQGANIHEKTIGGGTPLDTAVNCDHLEIVKWLLSLGANPDSKRGTSSALRSVKSLSVLEELLRFGQISNSARWSGLESAANESRFSVVERLLQSFDDDEVRQTTCEQVIVYLRNVAEAFETEPSSQMIAHLSGEPFDKEQASLEEERQLAEEESLRQFGKSYYAEQDADILCAEDKKDHVAHITNLIATGDFDSELSEPQSALGSWEGHRPSVMEFASTEGLETIVQSCLATRIAKPDALSKMSLGLCLSNAAQNGFDRIVKRLLDAGADPNFSDYNKSTPLIKSIKAKNLRTIEWLVDAGANLRALACGGQTPMRETFSVGLGKREIQSLLREKSKSQAPPEKPTSLLRKMANSSTEWTIGMTAQRTAMEPM